MKKVYDIADCRISVMLAGRSVHIDNDRELWMLLESDMERRSASLVLMIKEDFEQLQGRGLEISDASLVVEIWAHVYSEYFALVLDSLVRLKLVEKLVQKIVGYCEVIDCGEHGVDSNRKLWDMLAPYTGTIAGLLPEAIAAKGLKDQK